MSTNTQQREHINAFVDVDVRRKLECMAVRNERSLSAEIRLALRSHVEQSRDDNQEQAA